jgi:hypothetical protein
MLEIYYNISGGWELRISQLSHPSCTDKTPIIDYGTDEFAPKPLSMENVVDKAFMLIARDALKGDN